MQGYLKSPGHSYVLDADVISVGKGSGNKLPPPTKFKNASAHIPISSGKADAHHAIVEKNQDNNCFYLTDLNSAYGTYVNENRVQNSTVKLTPGDQIRFGYGGIIHEFGIYESENGKFPKEIKTKSHSKTAEVESGSIKFLNNKRPISAQSAGSSLLGYISSRNIARPDTAPDQNSKIFTAMAEKRAKSVPITINMRDIQLSDDSKTILSDKQTEASFHAAHQEGWSIDGQDTNDRDTAFSKASSWEKEQQEMEPWYISMLREKEQRLLHMGEEISRLTSAEQDSRRKDDIINDLRNKISELEIRTTNLIASSDISEKNNELLQMGDEIQRLTVYKQECERKDLLISTLKDQVTKLEIEKEALARSIEYAENIKTFSSPTNDSTDEIKQSKFTEHFEDNLLELDESLLKHQDELDEFRKQLNLPIPERKTPQEIIIELVSEVEQKEDIINELRGELKGAKHEKTLSQGFANSLQRDITRNEQKIFKLTTALAKSKKEAQEAITKAQAMSEKFSQLKEELKHEQIVEVLEKNYNHSQEKLKDVQHQLSKQQQKYDKQNKELRKASKQTKQHIEKDKQLQSQVEELQMELQDLHQKEQESRVLKEQTSSRLERLRSRIIQAVYTAPGSIKPESKLDDTEILCALEKLIQDRSEFHQQLCDLGHQVPPLTMALDIQSDDGSDPDVLSTTSEKKMPKTTKKGSKK